MVPTFDIPANFNQLADPYAPLRVMRDAGPVVRIRSEGGMDGWLITRYAEVRDGLADPRFSSDPRCASPQTLAAMSTTMSRTVSMFAGTMVAADPPVHTRLRRAVTPGFAGSPHERLRARLRTVAVAALDTAAEVGEADLAPVLVDSLVTELSGELMGIPPAERASLVHLMDIMVAMPIDAKAQEAADRAGEELAARFGALLGDAEQEGPRGLLGVVADARRQGLLDASEALTTALLLFGSSLINPRGALGCALLTLLARPDTTAHLKRSPETITSAVDELLRYDGPLALGMVRYAGEDVEVAGVTIPAGEQVYMGIGSANRDERRFEEPDAFNISRFDNAHLSFGNGVHRCLGVAATRVLVEVAVEALIDRWPAARLAVPIDAVRWHPAVIRSPAEIPVRA